MHFNEAPGYPLPPPPRITEADLIAVMDKEGIGTDATIAEHIKTIQDRGERVYDALIETLDDNTTEVPT